MPGNGTTEAGCSRTVAEHVSNTTSSQMERSVTASVISMTVGIISNTLALCILVKAYHRFRLKSKAFFLLFCSGLVVTDFLGHLINGSLVLYVYACNKKWEAFDPRHMVCGLFGVSMVFFGLSPLLLGSVMAVERCIGVTRPLFHSRALAAHHTKRLLALIWLLAALVALLPVLLWRPYQVQRSRSWCFFRLEGPRDWLDKLLPLIFSSLGLLALLVSIVCNMLTCCTLLLSKLRCRRHHLAKGTSHHLEMICQLMAILIVSCVCWGPLLVMVIILSTQEQGECPAFRLLMAIRMATWNQILDPWVYILLRKAVLKKVFLLGHSCWGTKSHSHSLPRWRCSTMKSSVETSVTSIRSKLDYSGVDGVVDGGVDGVVDGGVDGGLPDTVIKAMS
ncbi:prostaglandin F2-alpha receptor isoform X2 [Esox lucius]|uniref:Thromboxane A2 receptor n=1 Tax=Esox lucius TaxID=8010 RepID=A0A3P8YHW2_ESOLU|nr:prostaglandin F2-alpha receptor isoform X2 [Esox lucius]